MELIGSWQVVEIDGRAVLEDVVPTMDFDVDGRVHGLASVNRFHGGYTLSDDALTFSPLATTMMMGPPEPMDQEGRFLAALGAPLRATEPEDGRVELADDTHRIVLRRTG